MSTRVERTRRGSGGRSGGATRLLGLVAIFIVIVLARGTI